MNIYSPVANGSGGGKGGGISSHGHSNSHGNSSSNKESLHDMPSLCVGMDPGVTANDSHDTSLYASDMLQRHMNSSPAMFHEPPPHMMTSTSTPTYHQPQQQHHMLDPHSPPWTLYQQSDMASLQGIGADMMGSGPGMAMGLGMEMGSGCSYGHKMLPTFGLANGGGNGEGSSSQPTSSSTTTTTTLYPSPGGMALPYGSGSPMLGQGSPFFFQPGGPTYPLLYAQELSPCYAPMACAPPSTSTALSSFPPLSQYQLSYYEALQHKKRRRRLGTDETQLLVDAYDQNPKPNAGVRDALAKRLKMTPRAIQIWFQNRRAKMKRDHSDTSSGLIFSTSTSTTSNTDTTSTSTSTSTSASASASASGSTSVTTSGSTSSLTSSSSSSSSSSTSTSTSTSNTSFSPRSFGSGTTVSSTDVSPLTLSESRRHNVHMGLGLSSFDPPPAAVATAGVASSAPQLPGGFLELPESDRLNGLTHFPVGLQSSLVDHEYDITDQVARMISVKEADNGPAFMLYADAIDLSAFMHPHDDLERFFDVHEPLCSSKSSSSKDT